MYNEHTRRMATTRHKSMVERGGRKAFFWFLFEGVYERLTSAREARNNEIERHRVRSSPQMPNVRGCESGVGKAQKQV
jgi:hypothetical protein